MIIILSLLYSRMSARCECAVPCDKLTAALSACTVSRKLLHGPLYTHDARMMGWDGPTKRFIIDCVMTFAEEVELTYDDF